jgi:hypothetical protein
MYDGSTVTSLSRSVLTGLAKYVGQSNTVSNASGGTSSASSVTFGDTHLANDGRYIMALQYQSSSPAIQAATLLVFDTLTGRFGTSRYSYIVGVSGYAPTACWTNAENSRVIAVLVDVSGRKGGAIRENFAPNGASSLYLVYREQRGGNKATVNSGKLYFVQDSIEGNVSMSAKFPTASTSGTISLREDGTWSTGNFAAQRHLVAFTITSQHEVTDIEIDVASGGKDQSKPRGKQ